MNLIENIEEIKFNLETVEKYLSEGSEFEEDETKKLIKRGACFMAYEIGGELRFAPSRFIGYKENNLSKHDNYFKDGRKTNRVINKLIKPPAPDEELEEKYFEYCHSLGIYPNRRDKSKRPRKYWKLELGETDFPENEKSENEFPEGKIVERAHKRRERASKVIRLAKKKFKEQNGSLFCTICGFDFESKYGKIGEDFIEGHHTIPVSEMKPNQKTKPSDIAMVCSNCHRMLHRKRPWLKMDEIKKLLK